MPFPGTDPPGILKSKESVGKASEKDPGSGFAFKRYYLTRERVLANYAWGLRAASPPSTVSILWLPRSQQADYAGKR